MARATDPDSGSSQFFIVQADSTYLDGDYAGFGHVTDGMDVVDKIAETDTDYRDKPIVPQVMKKVTVETFGKDYPEPETVSRLLRHKYKVKEVPVVMRERQAGVSSISSLGKSVYYMCKVSLAILIERLR